MSFVLDCSATQPWIFADEAAEATDQLLDTLQNGAQARVPALWHLELANVLIGAQRRGRIDQAGIEAFLSHLTSYAISVDVETIPKGLDQNTGSRRASRVIRLRRRLPRTGSAQRPPSGNKGPGIDRRSAARWSQACP